MLASIFIVQGLDTLRHPDKVAPAAEPVVRALNERVPAVPAKAEDAVRLNGAIQLVAGSMLALGRLPRLSALVLAATLVPTTVAGHRFWEAEDGATKRQQQTHFLKNVTMAGGLLIAAGDTAGRPSVAWRTRYAAGSAKQSARSARRQATLVSRTAKVSGRAGAKAGRARGRVEARVGQLTG
jgi:putative oxidoreductase